MNERRINADAPPPFFGGNGYPLPPPSSVAPRPMRYVLKIDHAQFLLPPGMGIQEAAALAYTLGQSRQAAFNYNVGTRRMECVEGGEVCQIALSVIDPKDIHEPAVERGAES